MLQHLNKRQALNNYAVCAGVMKLKYLTWKSRNIPVLCYLQKKKGKFQSLHEIAKGQS